MILQFDYVTLSSSKCRDDPALLIGEMTMETMTDTKTMQVFVSPTILASINSLAQFADSTRGGNTSPITGLLLTRENDKLIAYSTNRYLLARGTYNENVRFENWDDDATVWIDQATLKQAVAITKNYAHVVVEIGYDTENRAFVDIAGNKLFHVAGQPSYPAVHRMFNDDTPNGVDRVSLNPQWLAMLAKVITPTTKQDKHMPWEFNMFHSDENNKPMPVVARLYPKTDTDWEIRVLIQPNLVVR
jgi:hypothetical protein